MELWGAYDKSGFWSYGKKDKNVATYRQIINKPINGLLSFIEFGPICRSYLENGRRFAHIRWIPVKDFSGKRCWYRQSTWLSLSPGLLKKPWHTYRQVIHIEWCHEYLEYPSRGRSPREWYPKYEWHHSICVLYHGSQSAFCILNSK